MLRRLTFALLLLVGALLPAQADERILNFVSDVAVQRNGDLVVTETIRVRAEGNVIKRGILRDFPTTYGNRDGTRVEVGFDVTSVKRDGVSESFAMERMSNGWRVRIGRADVTLSNGTHDYVIVYRTTRQIGFFDSFDELYWNATGNGWTFPIDVAEARITLPEAVSFSRRAFYTGPQGATGKDAEILEQGSGRIVFRTTKPLPPGNGLTVAAGWQKGVVDQPSTLTRKANWIADNLPVFLAFAVLVGVLGYYVYAWLKVGRDPLAGTIVPLFSPPDGMSPGAVRYVSRMEMDNRVFTVALLDLAVKGHVRLTEKKEEGMRITPRTGGKPLDVAGQTLMARLFGKRKSPIDLDNSYNRIFEKANAALSDTLKRTYSDKLFLNNTRWSVQGIIAALGLSALVLLSVFATWGADEGITTLIGMASFVPALIVLTLVMVLGFPRSISGFFFLAFGCVFSFIVGHGGFKIMDHFQHGWLQAIPAALPIVLVPVASSAFGWMKAHTAEGRRIVDQIEGFRQYLGVVEGDRLNALNPPEETAELFERYLPYAIALDVENEWGKRFESVLAAMAIDPNRHTDDDWYRGDRNWTSDPASFASALGDDLSRTISSATTPPGSSSNGSSSSDSSSSSSGSDGGGSSGGGGGGGGGSGW